MSEILKFIDRWAGGVTQLAAILLPIVFYLLAYRYADKRTIEYRWLRDASFVILLVLSAGNLAKLASDQYSKWTEDRRKPIEISPSEISFRPDSFKSSRTVTVTNRSELPIHQIWIKVDLSETGVHWNQVEIKPRFAHEKRQLVTGPAGPLYLSSDVWGLGAMDARGRELLCLMLRSVPPKASLAFDLSLPSKAEASDTHEGKLILDVWSYSTEPTEFVEREHDGGREGGVKISIPETITALGTCAILSPDQN